MCVLPLRVLTIAISFVETLNKIIKHLILAFLLSKLHLKLLLKILYYTVSLSITFDNLDTVTPSFQWF